MSARILTQDQRNTEHGSGSVSAPHVWRKCLDLRFCYLSVCGKYYQDDTHVLYQNGVKIGWCTLTYVLARTPQFIGHGDQVLLHMPLSHFRNISGNLPCIVFPICSAISRQSKPFGVKRISQCLSLTPHCSFCLVFLMQGGRWHPLGNPPPLQQSLHGCSLIRSTSTLNNKNDLVSVRPEQCIRSLASQKMCIYV